ncbi:hypothetical protein B0H11DRAFT_1901289 [Mycena galericulata]|nr:hypothetical protein B0H11DRAFT_1901289 [Mycena galericulata]
MVIFRTSPSLDLPDASNNYECTAELEVSGGAVREGVAKGGLAEEIGVELEAAAPTDQPGEPFREGRPRCSQQNIPALRAWIEGFSTAERADIKLRYAKEVRAATRTTSAVVRVGEIAVRSEADKEVEDWATEVIVVGSGIGFRELRFLWMIKNLIFFSFTGFLPQTPQFGPHDNASGHQISTVTLPEKPAIWDRLSVPGPLGLYRIRFMSSSSSRPLALEPRLIYAKQLIYHTRACGIPARLHLFKILQSTFGFRGYHSIVKRAAHIISFVKGDDLFHPHSSEIQLHAEPYDGYSAMSARTPAPGPRGTDLHIQTSEFGLNRWRSHGQMTSSISIWFRAHERPQAENGIRAPMDSRLDKTDSTKLNRGNDVSARLGPA